MLRSVGFDAPRMDEKGRYRLRGAGIADRAAVQSLLSPTLMESHRNVTATVIVMDAGLVERIRFDYTVHRGTASVRVTREIRYSDVGDTTLERPYGSRTLPGPATMYSASQATGVRSTTVPS